MTLEILDKSPYIWLPTRYMFTVWWPWVQNYNGELRAGTVRPGPIYARIGITKFTFAAQRRKHESSAAGLSIALANFFAHATGARLLPLPATAELLLCGRVYRASQHSFPSQSRDSDDPQAN